jgi:hypothetical protein
MGRTYWALLRALEARRFRVFGRRVSLPAYRKLAIAITCWMRARWGRRRPAARPRRA